MKYYATTKERGAGLKSFNFEVGGSVPTARIYENVWDADMLYGCHCDDGFYGYDCSLRSCSTGDDPMTSGKTEKQRLTCTADGGSLLLGFRGEWTTAIPYSSGIAQVKAKLQELSTISQAGGLSGVDVVLSAPATVWCDKEGGTATTIEFMQHFGDELPLIQAKLDYLTLTTGTASLDAIKFRVGSKEDLPCSGRGLCDTLTGTCECSLLSSCAEDCWTTSDGFGEEGRRGDCGAALVTVDDCPGEVACSSLGYCDETTYACDCQEGYTGADCSIMTCPNGKSWFSYPTDDDIAHLQPAECSDMGKCNRDHGECECAPGFEGAACQYTTCPGADISGPCSYHGECLSMQLLAAAAQKNGVRTELTYGSTPNDAAHWDFEKIRGCKCDSGYTYWDCSGQLCPYGDDPLSNYFQDNEIQLMNCDLNDNTPSAVYLTFREEVTVALNPATMTLADLELALEELWGIWDVKLSLHVVGGDDDSNFVCSTSGTNILIDFLRPTGDLPLLEASDASITISEYKTGTKEWEECSGRGLCDRTSGVCNCFSGYGSSNGQGGPGPYGDCGYSTSSPQAILAA